MKGKYIIVVLAALMFCGCKQRVTLNDQEFWMMRLVEVSSSRNRALSNMEDQIYQVNATGYCPLFEDSSELTIGDLQGEVVLTKMDGDTLMVRNFDPKTQIYDPLKIYVSEGGVNYCALEIRGSLIEVEGGYYLLEDGSEKLFMLDCGRVYLAEELYIYDKGARYEEMSYYANGHMQHHKVGRAVGTSVDDIGESYIVYQEDVDDYYTEEGMSLNKIEREFYKRGNLLIFSGVDESLYMILKPRANSVYSGRAAIIRKGSSSTSIESYWRYQMSNSGELRLYSGVSGHKYLPRYYDYDVSCSFSDINEDELLVKVGNAYKRFSLSRLKVKDNNSSWRDQERYIDRVISWLENEGCI
jgi:hypothetical protein